MTPVTDRRRWRPGHLAAGAAAFLIAMTACGTVAGASGTWTTYHGDLSRSGDDVSEASLAGIHHVWSAGLDGTSVYGSPVVADGRVFVATEDDDVYALDAHDGHVLWSRNIGAPLRGVSAAVGCGNIDPLGVTSTPVVDTSRNTVYVVGEVSHGGALPVEHVLVGFDVYSGAQRLQVSADPSTGDNLKYLQQRAALALANGRVYVAYGGLDGDCGTYHGWVVGVDESGARPAVQFDVTPSSTGGAIWDSGGGPSVDGAGSVYVTTGNPNSGGSAPWAEAVVKLTAGLGYVASFQDTSATGDADLGTGDALLLPDGDLFTVGKTDIGYLLHQSNLTRSHAIAGTVCGSDPDGGATWDQATDSVYVPCRGGGIQQVSLSTYATGWHRGSANGSPVLADGGLWSAAYGSNYIQELNPATGALEQQVSTTANLPTFATPSVADGLVLVGTRAGVDAFAGPSGVPPAAPPPPAAAAPTAGYRLLAKDGGVFDFGTARFYGSLGRLHLAAPVVGGATTPDGRGYWMVAADGGVFAFGDARFYGSMGGHRLTQPVVGMAAAPDGAGYWLVARDGGVFTFGPGARFRGSVGGRHLTQPVVGMAADSATGGYWLFAADGGVFAFGAPFDGSAGGLRLTRPVVAGAAVPAGRGYRLVASDGGVFDFGPGAAFHGSTGGVRLVAPIVGLAGDDRTGGYWLAAADGGVFAFDAPFYGSMGGTHLTQPVVAVTPA